jgi:uncharacterized membrane protein YdjX (TVP38/TMEM64 family)
MTPRSPWVLLVVIAALFVGGHYARNQVGVEFGVEPLRDWVRGLGLVAPIVYVGLVTFRQFLLVPSSLVLATGGLAFGAALGTLLGGLGIVLSALLGFTLARTLGREWLRLRMGDRLAQLERHSERVGPLLVGLATAHPLGPMSPFHWGAGLASMSALAFFAVVLVAGPARAFLLSTLGASLAEPRSVAFWVVAALVGALLVLPLAHPAVRRRLLGRVMPGSLQ